MSTTATEIIAGAFDLLTVNSPGETMDAASMQDARRRLNRMIEAWSIQALAVPFVARQVFDLTSGRGGPDDPYTIGPGGDFNTTRPWSLTGAALLLTASVPAVEVPLGVLTDDGFQAIAIKGLSNGQPTSVYYQRTSADGFGTIILWPIPNTDLNDLVLYRGDQIVGFVDLTTAYDLPPGADEALEYNLALRLASPYGRTVPDDIAVLAGASLDVFKRANLRMSDLRNDFPFGGRGGYNIQTGH